MPIRLGSQAIIAAMLGSTTISRVYHGEQLVFGEHIEPEPTDGLSNRWRIRMTAKQGTGWTAWREVEMRGERGGPDLCVGGTPTASASNGNNPPALAFDGNLGGEPWTTGTGTLPQWLEYEFPNPVTIEEVALTPYVINDTATTFAVEYWDGTAWVTYWSVANVAWQNTSTRVFGREAKRLWRVNITATVNSGSWPGIREIEFRTAAGGADQTNATSAGGEGPLASHNKGEAARVFDNTTAQWGAGANVKPTWLGWAFAEPKEIVEVAISGPSGTGDAPRDFTIDYWDGAAWVTARTVAGEVGWSAGQTRVFGL